MAAQFWMKATFPLARKLATVSYRSIGPALAVPWWRHQMETFSALLAICAGNSLVPGDFPAQRPVTRSFDVFFDLHPNKRLSKQWWGWWFETPSCPLWRRRNAVTSPCVWRKRGCVTFTEMPMETQWLFKTSRAKDGPTNAWTVWTVVQFYGMLTMDSLYSICLYQIKFCEVWYVPYF